MHTYSLELPTNTQKLVQYLQLLLLHKEEIVSSYLSYNVETGVRFTLMNGNSYNLMLGDVLNLWSKNPRNEDNIWHFFNQLGDEVYTIGVRQIDIDSCFVIGFNLMLGRLEYGIASDDLAINYFNDMIDEIAYMEHPTSTIHSKMNALPTIYSILKIEDIADAVSSEKSCVEIYKEKQKEIDNRVITYKSFLVPKLEQDMTDIDYVIKYQEKGLE